MANIEAKSRDEWMKLASSADAVQRKQVTEALRALGVNASEFMPMDAAARVDYIMSKQGEPGGQTSSKKDAAAPPSSDKGGGGGMSAADRAMLKGISEKVAENNTILRKVHDMLAIQILSQPAVKANAEESDIKIELLGNG